MEEMMKRNITGLDIVGALSRSGFEDIASNILNMLRQRKAPAITSRPRPFSIGSSRW